MAKFNRYADENILYLEYNNTKKENKAIKCTRSKLMIENKLANYLESTPEKLGRVLVCDLERMEIQSIPIVNIHYCSTLSSLKQYKAK